METIIYCWYQEVQEKIDVTHLIFTCSKSAMETLEKNMKYVQG